MNRREARFFFLRPLLTVLTSRLFLGILPRCQHRGIHASAKRISHLLPRLLLLLPLSLLVVYLCRRPLTLGALLPPPLLATVVLTDSGTVDFGGLALRLGWHGGLRALGLVLLLLL